MQTKIGNIKLIIFDWSGVISDDREPVYRASMEILAKFSKPKISYEAWWRDLKMSLSKFLVGQGIQLSHDQVNKEFLEAYQKVIQKGIRPKMFAEVPGILTQLHRDGFRLAVVSAHPPRVLVREAEMYGIKEFFALIEGWATSCKEEGIIKACDILEVPPEEAAYVGDMVMDIRSAKKAGVHSIGIARENDQSYHRIELLRSEKPEILGQNLKEVFCKIGVCA